MEDGLKCDSIVQLKKSVRKSDVLQAKIETVDFLILKLDRYIIDPAYVSQTGFDTSRYIDAYDALICDDSHKVKVLLSPDLNSLIQQGQVAVGNLIRLTKCSLKYDESVLTCCSILIVHDLEVTGCNSDDISVKLLLPWSPECNIKEELPSPLASERGYYVNLWSTAETSGLIWKTSEELENAADCVHIADLVSVRDVAKQWKYLKGSQPCLLVKVLLKSRLVHYARPSKCDKWPFQVHLTVGDESGICSAVLWNSLCPKYYLRIKEGSLLLIKNCAVKKRYSLLSTNNPIIRDHQQYDIDLNLNAHHPVAEIHILDPTTVPMEVKQTILKQQYNFISRRELGSLPDNYICDVIGVVMYISHNQRELMPCKYGVDSGGYWIRTWIGLLDGTSPKPVFVQLYNCSPDVLLELEPGQILMVRHVRVIQNFENLQNSLQPKHVFVTSMKESQTYIIHPDDPPTYLLGENSVKNILKWCPEDACKNSVLDATVGGYFTFPPLPTCLQTMMNNYSDIKILQSCDWSKEIESVALKESRRVFIQAFLVYIQYIPSEREHRDSRKRKADGKIQPTVKLSKTLNEHEQRMQRTHSVLGSSFDEVSIYTAPIPHSKLKCSSIEVLGHSWNCDNQLYQHLNELENWEDTSGWNLVWQGLNFPSTLNSVLTSSQHVTERTTMSELLSGNCENDALTSSIPITEDNVKHILNTADELSNQHFLVVLDLYRFHKQTVCVNVNRAFPLGTQS